VYLNGYNNTNPDVIPESEIEIYVQDALNELEFIMGGVHTKYGALRASLGYPNPWKINYVEVWAPLSSPLVMRHTNINHGYRLATRIIFLIPPLI
jgi:hypothetical protein